MGAIYFQIAVVLTLVAVVVFFALDDWKSRKLREKEDEEASKDKTETKQADKD